MIWSFSLHTSIFCPTYSSQYECVYYVRIVVYLQRLESWILGSLVVRQIMHLTDSHVYQCTIDFYMWSVACSIVYARTCVTLAKWSRISLQAIVMSQNLMVSCEAHWNIAERPQLWCLYHLPHFPRLSLTQSVVFSWDHTHQVCLALVLQCSLASQLPLWPCSVYSPSNNLYCGEDSETVVLIIVALSVSG